MAFRNACKFVSVVLGPLLIILGVCVKWAIFPPVVDNLVHSYLTLEPSNTDTWDAWIEPTSQQPLFMKFTFFNVENEDEIVANNTKPRVTEKGAFAYREVRRKEHVRSLLDEISYGSYTHYEFDADESDEGSKDPETKVTIINPVLAIINAVQLQLHERLLQFSSFDTILSFMKNPPFNIDCGELEATDTTIGDMICAAIPNDVYQFNCTTVEEILAVGCADQEPPLSDICGMLPAVVATACTEDTDGDGEPDTMIVEYRDGQIFFPSLGTDPFPITCNMLMDAVSTVVPLLGVMDCADPLRLWGRVEKFLLNPLADLTNCEPNEFPEDVSICTGADDSFYENVPKECFCDRLTMTDTVNNLIFKGAHSGMLLAAHNVLEHADLGALVPNFDLLGTLIPQLKFIVDLISPRLKDVDLAAWIDQTLAGMGLDLLDLKHGKFGFFRGPNGSNATRSWWKINSGKYQFDLYNQIIEFNGMTRLPENWWYGFGPTPSAHASGVRGICHDIIGADGISYPPEAINKEDSLWLFNEQLSRSIWLDFIQEADVDGITTYQYSPSPEVFAMTNPDNFCYCPEVEKCAKVDESAEDAWDMSDCQDRTHKLLPCVDGLLFLQGSYNVPIIMSTPHFLDADESLWKAIDGVQPDREKHITFLNIEPTTGMSIQAHKRIQVSLPVRDSDYFKDLQNLAGPVNGTVWPVVWVDEGADANQENLDMLKSMLVTPFMVVDVVSYLLIGIGGVLLILSASLHFFCKPS